MIQVPAMYLHHVRDWGFKFSGHQFNRINKIDLNVWTVLLLTIDFVF